mmetsp:Transcript_112612/g.223907  ORF Transcript_112612/g.223907 Transcript_112612/m.223907 type:complete len:274 (-) Transcript_112612:534-1355(-)
MTFLVTAFRVFCFATAVEDKAAVCDSFSNPERVSFTAKKVLTLSKSFKRCNALRRVASPRFLASTKAASSDSCCWTTNEFLLWPSTWELSLAKASCSSVSNATFPGHDALVSLHIVLLTLCQSAAGPRPGSPSSSCGSSNRSSGTEKLQPLLRVARSCGEVAPDAALCIDVLNTAASGAAQAPSFHSSQSAGSVNVPSFAFAGAAFARGNSLAARSETVPEIPAAADAPESRHTSNVSWPQPRPSNDARLLHHLSFSRSQIARQWLPRLSSLK